MHRDELALVRGPVMVLHESAQVILLQGDLLPEQRLQVEDHAFPLGIDLLQIEGDDPARSDLVDDGAFVAHHMKPSSNCAASLIIVLSQAGSKVISTLASVTPS